MNKSVPVLLLLLTVLFLLPLVASAGGDCSCDPKYKYKADIIPGDCMNYESYNLVCKNCGHVVACLGDKGDHNWSDVGYVEEPTCTQPGGLRQECLVCGRERVLDVKPLGHRMDWEIVQAATCKEDGIKYGVCSRCGKTETKNYSGGEHMWDQWTILTAATDHSTGFRTHTCTVCGDSKKEEYYPDGTLRRSGGWQEGVPELQEMLIELGFLSDKADGIFGPKTEQAVRDFQRSKGLEVTGIAFPQTITALDHEVNGVPCCRIETTPDGEPVLTFCEHHSEMYERYSRDQSMSDSDPLTASYYRKLWENELDKLYDTAIAAAGEDSDSVAALKLEQFLFKTRLSSLETVWRQDSDSPEVDYLATEELIRQCVLVCGYMNNSEDMTT